MRKIIFGALLFTLGIGFTLSASAQKKKNTIAVLNFINSGGVDKNEISILKDRFNNYLVNTNVYKVLEREKMTAILKEQNFSMSDNCNSSECDRQEARR
jgi:curli biogenesis system outer membrane secretion channel CsgG